MDYSYSFRSNRCNPGGVAALALLGSLLSSPLFGILYDRTRNARALMLLCGIAGVLGLEIASLPNIVVAIFANLLAGFASGGSLTIGFSASRAVAGAEYEALAVGCTSTTQLFSEFLFPPIFSLTVFLFGYSGAWIISGLYTAPFVAIAIFAKPKDLSQVQVRGRSSRYGFASVSTNSVA